MSVKSSSSIVGKNSGAFFVAFAAVLWSLDGIVRAGLRNPSSSLFMASINVVFWEHFLGFLLILPFAIWKRKELAKLNLKDWAIFAAIGLFASVLGTLFYTAALGQIFFVSFSVVVLLQKLQPIWAILSARLILKEKLPPQFLIWALIALFAAFLISFKDLKVDLNTGNGTLLAAIFGVLASIFWGLGTTFGKLLLNKVGSITATGIRFGFGTVFSFILTFLLAWFFEPLSKILSIPLGAGSVNLSLSVSQLQSLLIVVFVTGLVAMVIYYFGLKNTQAKIATLCELMWPASALVIDMFYDIYRQKFGFRPDIFSWSQVFGIVLLLISVYFISRTEKISENEGHTIDFEVGSEVK